MGSREYHRSAPCLCPPAGAYGLLRSEAYDRRIDNVMPLALSYIIWFGVIPLVSFL